MIILTNANSRIDKPTAAALGTFDGIHMGHRSVIDNMMKYAEENGLSPLVYSISGVKTAPLLMTLEMKTDILRGLGIQFLVNPDFKDIKDCLPEVFVRDYLRDRLNVKAVFCGENYRFGKNASAKAKDMQQLCKKYGMDCVVVPFVMSNGQIVSSSVIRDSIEKGDIKSANSMLGHPFTIDITVSYGNKIGRVLGAPTINQLCPPEAIQPKRGVYASFVQIDGEILPAVTNFGVKPTVSNHQTPLYETWIMGFNGDLYGKKIPVSLLEMLRSEQRFDSLDSLKNQIFLDGGKSRTIFEQYCRQGNI